MTDKRSTPTARGFRQPVSRGAFLRTLMGGGLALACGPGRLAAAAVPIATRPIPSTGEALPVVGVGTWQTFDIGTGQAERAQRREVLRLLFESGGSVIDSSPMYGRSEGVVGDLLTDLGARDRAFLATKVWTNGRQSGISQMENSLARFQSPTMDLMQVHNLVDWQTHLKTLRAWKEEGRFRYIGLTHYTRPSLDRLAELIENNSVDFIQFAYSLNVREAEQRLLPLAADRGVATIINRPFEGGSLFRKTRGRPLPDWAPEVDCTSWAQIFLKFILSHPAVTCVIPGTDKPVYMTDNLGAGRGRLPDEGERARMVRTLEAL